MKHDVFQVLVPSTVLSTAGNTIDSLTPKQIGIFDVDTQKSVIAAGSQRIFLGMGASSTGSTTTIDTLVKSAGQYIPVKGVTNITYKPYTAPVNQVVKITGFSAKCQTEYGVKIEFRNQLAYVLNGTTQLSKTYIIKTGCCENQCEPCADGSCTEIAQLLITAINSDTAAPVTAAAIDSTGTVVSDIPTWAADTDNAGKCLDIQLTAKPLAEVAGLYNINPEYFNPRNTTMITSLVAGFECNGSVVETTPQVMEQGAGYDVRQREYFAGGWNGKPGVYRVGELSGLPSRNFIYYSDLNTNYDTIIINYDFFSVSGWKEYLNGIATEIYVPTGGTVGSSLATLLSTVTGVPVNPNA